MLQIFLKKLYYDIAYKFSAHTDSLAQRIICKNRSHYAPSICIMLLIVCNCVFQFKGFHDSGGIFAAKQYNTVKSYN
jgi:hypothetical protein